ncbi:MAG: PorV/PorQ family protein [Candidatus Firestonebacteria bacterium]
MLMKIFITIILLCGMFLEAEAGNGTSNFQFLRLVPGARAVGMGEVSTGVNNNAYSSYFNPAGLSKTEETEVSLAYSKYWQEINYGYIGFSKNISEGQGVGGYIIYLDYGKMEQSAEDENGLYDSAKSGGSYGASDLAVGVSYGLELISGLSVGICGKIISGNIDTDNLTGYGIDLGMLYSLPSGADMGVALQNLGMKSKDKSLPLTLKAGTSISANVLSQSDLILAIDSSYLVESNKLIWNAGVEYSVLNMISVRVGYKTGSEQESITCGIGFKVPLGEDLESSIDYAFVPSKDLESTHRVSLNISVKETKE